MRDKKEESIDIKVTRLKNMLNTMISLSDKGDKDFLFEMNQSFEELYKNTFPDVNKSSEIIFDLCRQSCLAPHYIGVDKDASLKTAKNYVNKIEDLYLNSE